MSGSMPRSWRMASVQLDSGGSGTGKTEVVVAALEMLSGRGKKENAKEAQAVAEAPGGADDEPTSINAHRADPESDLEAVVAL